jgi:hypothetical protein
MLGEEDTGSQLARELELPNCPWAAGPLELEGLLFAAFWLFHPCPFPNVWILPGGFFWKWSFSLWLSVWAEWGVRSSAMGLWPAEWWLTCGAMYVAAPQRPHDMRCDKLAMRGCVFSLSSGAAQLWPNGQWALMSHDYLLASLFLRMDLVCWDKIGLATMWGFSSKGNWLIKLSAGFFSAYVVTYSFRLSI